MLSLRLSLWTATNRYRLSEWRTVNRAHQENAELLFRLRRLRTRADYDDGSPHA
jgi:hypothetical protein